MNFIVDHFSAIFLGLGVLAAFWFGHSRSKQEKSGKKKLEEAIKSNSAEPMTLHPEINSTMCIGCGGCTKVCPEGDILKLINHKAVLVAPTKCVGHGECEAACPMGAIDLVFGTKTRGMDIPRVTTNFETNVPGLYIAGELGGMGLIRNAVKQGRLAARHALGQLGAHSAQYDVLVVGAGPAGFSAALTAIEMKKKYLCIEQQSFGGTIYNFPRQKLVMSHPFELSITGKASFPANEVTKEQLLGFFSSVRKKTGLNIQEGVKFEGIESSDGIFHVKTSKGSVTAKKVILAMGVRGSPRKLGVPGEDKKKVTYNLLEPEQYKGKKILVVGGGNAAAEVAQMLAAHNLGNSVRLLVRGAVMDRCNDDNKNRLQALVQQRRLEIWYDSGIEKIEDKTAIVNKGGVSSEIENDFVFVMVGAEMPHKFLMSLGIEIDKKFGEAVGKPA